MLGHAAGGMVVSPPQDSAPQTAQHEETNKETSENAPTLSRLRCTLFGTV